MNAPKLVDSMMKLARRKFLHLIAGALAMPAMPRVAAAAQGYPSRPVRLIVPFGSAGATDIVARLIGQWLSERLAQPFVIENRPGAGGNLGMEALVRSPPDGYTLALMGLPSAINVTLYQNLSFNLARDIAPVAGIVRFPNLMVVNPTIPAKTVPEFIAYAKAHPGRLNMSSPGNGSTPHVFGELFKMMAGIDMVHVPYRSVAAAMTDMLSGQVQVAFGTSASTIEYVRAGTLRALAVTTATRSDCCRSCRQSPNSCRATRRAHGSGLQRRGIRQSKLSKGSTQRSTPASLSPGLMCGLPTLAVSPFLARLMISRDSSIGRSRNGPRSSSFPAQPRSDKMAWRTIVVRRDLHLLDWETT